MRLLLGQADHPHRPRARVPGTTVYALLSFTTVLVQVRVCENCYIGVTEGEKKPLANFFDTK